MTKIQNLISDLGTEKMDSRDTPRLLPWIVQEMPSGESCLAVGCGDGTEVQVLQGKYKKAMGLDINPANSSDLVKCGDMHEIPLNDGEVDVVLSKDSFEHATAPAVVMSELARVSKKYVVVVLPDEAWTEHRWHLIIPNMRQMMWLAERVGLKMVKFRDLRTVVSGTYLFWYHLYVFEK